MTRKTNNCSEVVIIKTGREWGEILAPKGSSEWEEVSSEARCAGGEGEGDDLMTRLGRQAIRHTRGQGGGGGGGSGVESWGDPAIVSFLLSAHAAQTDRPSDREGILAAAVRLGDPPRSNSIQGE